MVPMQFQVKERLVEESERLRLKFPKSVVQQNSAALSEICLLNSNMAEGLRVI